MVRLRERGGQYGRVSLLSIDGLVTQASFIQHLNYKIVVMILPCTHRAPVEPFFASRIREPFSLPSSLTM